MSVAVAPCTGAWIEILGSIDHVSKVWVAPFTGAWIEIFRQCSQAHYSVSSLPSRERGLKSHLKLALMPAFGVAPFTGAWIEIQRSPPWRWPAPSLPSRERGLKLVVGLAVETLR